MQSLTHPPSRPFPATRVRPSRWSSLALIVMATVVGAGSESLADTIVWSGGGADLNWSTAANWQGGAGPGATDEVWFLDAGSALAPGTVNNLVDGAFAGTVGSVHYGNTNGFHTTEIDFAVTLNITGPGGLVVGTPGDPGAAVTVTATMLAQYGGLNLDHPEASLVINQGTATSANGSRAILDLQSVDTFTANLSRIGIGTTTLPNPGGVSQREAGVLYLAKKNHLTVGYAVPLETYLTLPSATNGLEISHNPGNHGGTFSQLFLGESNVFYIDSIGVGRSKASATAAGVIAFNPTFGNNSVAFFRGLGGDASRVAWWAIGDMGANSSSSQVAIGFNDFSNGRVDALVDVMSLGRDCAPQHTATGSTRTNLGVLTFTAGIIDVNTLLVGNQALGPIGSTTPNVGIVQMNGASATLIVNSNLVLGNTTVNSVAASKTSGFLFVNGGTVRANAIRVGEQSTNNVINLDSATLVISNTAGTPARAITTVSATESTFEFHPGPATPIMVVTNLVTGGLLNAIDIGSAAVFSFYPTQVVLIDYEGEIGGAGFNFLLGSMPPNAIGYLSNNTFNTSIDLVLSTDPRPAIAPSGQPQSLSLAPGQTAVFTVTASGTPPFSYQWRQDNSDLTDGGNVSGSTAATLTINDAQAADAADYTVVVANAFGSVTSQVAVLTVSSGDVAPAISQQPQDLAVTVGQTATFNVVATGLPAPTYRWHRNGVALVNGGRISGATTANLAILDAQPADAGAYSVGVTNSVGGVHSEDAILSVNVPPTITVPPASVVVNHGASASFTVEATGTPAPTYQWQWNGASLPDATNATLEFVSVQPTNAGAYVVIVSNPAGTVTSDPATLTVTSPTLAPVSVTPVNGATEICADTPLSITFNEPPTLANRGAIRIYDTNGVAVDTIDLSLNSAAGYQPRNIAGASYSTYPVIITGNTAAIYPHLGVLTSNQAYSVTVDPGTFRDGEGADFVGISDPNAWRFTTKVAGPLPGFVDSVVVAADGSGDFCTVQGAIDWVPAGNVTPILIQIRPGVYREINRVNGKNNLTFRGVGGDVSILTYANNDRLNAGTSSRILFYAGGNDLAFEHLSLINSTPDGGSQAEALRVQGQRVLLDHVVLASYQDTLLVNSAGHTAYFINSRVQGDTDFIWGSGTVVFQSCEIRALDDGHNCQMRTPMGQHGAIFLDCWLTQAGEVGSHSLGHIGANSYPYSMAAYVNCRMDAHINPVGWFNTDAGDTSSLRFWEYQSTTLDGTTPVDVSSRAPFSLQIDAGTAASLRDFNTVYAGTWTPQLPAYLAVQPADQTAVVGQTVTLAVAAGGVEAPTYQWLHGGSPIAGATNETHVIASAQLSDAGTYAVIVSNSLNTETSRDAVLTVSDAVRPTAGGATLRSDGTMQFTISGAAGQSYRVWASANVALFPVTETWSLLTNATFDNEPVIFTDPQATNFAQRFYQVTVP